jgi:imidazolonepropionase-like amidohydrolase
MTMIDRPPLYIEGATLIDGTGGPPLPESAVVLRDGRVEAVGRMGQLPRPEAAQRLDAAGLYLIPGLIDAHAHVEAVDAWAVEALHAQGVTALRNPATRVGCEHRDPDAPAILSAGTVIDAPPRDRPEADYVTSPEEARAAVRRQAAAGVDLVKLYTKLPPDLLRAAVAQAHDLGLRAMGDLRATSWTEAARAGIDFLCHAAPYHPALLPAAARAAYRAEIQRHPERAYTWLERVDLDGAEIAEMITALARAGVAVDPTLVASEALFFAGDPTYTDALTPAQAAMPRAQRTPPAGDLPRMSEYLQTARSLWRKTLGLVRRLHRGGVALLAGTDTPRPWVAPGHSLHRELTLLVQAGLSPAEALGSATGDAAAALGLCREVGSVTVGARADLVLLEADPLLEIHNTRTIARVILGGEPLEAGA